MVNPNRRSFKPNFINELNIESIISAPLVAASKANVVMVTGQTRFILDYCFTKEERKEGNHIKTTYRPVMIEMSLTRGVIIPGTPEIPEKKDANGKVLSDKVEATPTRIQNTTKTINIPLLTIVPLNSLVIDKVNVDFDMDITSVTYYTPISKITNDQPHLIEKQAQLNGRIGYDPNTKKGDLNQNKSQMTSRLKVSIEASPLPLPVGILTILDMYSKSIQPLPPEKE